MTDGDDGPGRRPTVSGVVAFGLGALLLGVLLLVTAGSLAAGLGVGTVLTLAVGFGGRLTRSAFGYAVAGVALPVAAVGLLGTVALTARAGPPVLVLVAAFGVSGGALLAHAAVGWAGRGALWETARTLLLTGVCGGAVVALLTVGPGAGATTLDRVLADSREAFPVTGFPALVLFGGDVVVLAVALSVARRCVTRFEARGTEARSLALGDVPIRWALRRLLWAVLLLPILAAVLPLLVDAAVGTALTRVVAGLARDVGGTLRTHVAVFGLLGLTFAAYLLLAATATVERGDPERAVRTGAGLAGPVALGVGTAVVWTRFGVAERLPPAIAEPLAVAGAFDAAVVPLALLAPAALLWIVFRVGVGGLGLATPRGLAGAGSAGLFVATPFAGLASGRPSVALGGVAVAIVVWDLQENGIGLREQLGADRALGANEVLHAGATAVVAAVAVGLGYVVSLAAAGDTVGVPPYPVVFTVLAGTLLLLLLVYRTASVEVRH